MADRTIVVVLALAVVAGTALAGLFANPSPLQTPIVYVDALGNCRGNSPCETQIGAAVKRVDANGTVFVYGYNGTYGEVVSISKPLTLRGEDRAGVVVDGNATAASVIDVRSDDVLVETLSLVQGSVGLRATNVANVTVRDVYVTSVATGVLATNTIGFTLASSGIEQPDGNGVEVHGSEDVVVGGGNAVLNASARGVWVNDSLEVEIRDNVIRGSGLTGLNVSFSVNVTVEGNTIEDNGADGFFAHAPGPRPLQAGGGGLWFWEVDPVYVAENSVKGNSFFGLEIAGKSSTDFTLRGNDIRDNDGPGVVLTAGASRIDLADVIAGNRGHGIVMDDVSQVTIHDTTVEDNLGMGVKGQRSVNVAVRDSRVARNGVVVPFAADAGGSPSPHSGHSGGMWFWEVDPSEIRGNDIVGNFGPGVTLIDTVDFDVVDNVIEGNSNQGVLLIDANRSRISGNRIADDGGAGTELRNSTNVAVYENTYEDLALGILIDGGCSIRLRGNTFTNVTQTLEIRGSPCDVILEGVATLRFMPSTLNLKDRGKMVTLTFTVEGLTLDQYEASSLTFLVNGTALEPPPGSPSKAVFAGGLLRAMVKLDRAEAIAAMGGEGTYVIQVLGEITPGVHWVAEDTVRTILPP